MLLVQPLKIEDINIHIKEEDDTQQEPQPSSNQIPRVSPIVDMIDDAELLAILGIPPTSITQVTTSPVSIEDCLLDWDNMPELLSDGNESVASTTQTQKRKHDDELFVLLDFEEYKPIMSSKKLCLTPNSHQEPQVEAATPCQQGH